MFSESIEIYDAIYCAMKDYAAEARSIAALIRQHHSKTQTVLDVACGTGEHARHLAAEHGLTVDGIDLEAGFVELAQRKNPAGRFVRADMTGFELGRRYDAVLCMFSSIGYVRTLENVTKTLCQFRAHLEPRGVIVVEPWATTGFGTARHARVPKWHPATSGITSWPRWKKSTSRGHRS